MSIYDLANYVTIQGKVRLSVWDEDNEEHILFEGDTDDVITDVTTDWEDYEVQYLFCVDGVLHIELSTK